MVVNGMPTEGSNWIAPSRQKVSMCRHPDPKSTDWQHHLHSALALQQVAAHRVPVAVPSRFGPAQIWFRCRLEAFTHSEPGAPEQQVSCGRHTRSIPNLMSAIDANLEWKISSAYFLRIQSFKCPYELVKLVIRKDHRIIDRKRFAQNQLSSGFTCQHFDTSQSRRLANRQMWSEDATLIVKRYPHFLRLRWEWLVPNLVGSARDLGCRLDGVEYRCEASADTAVENL